MNRLAGKVALITGAARGMGETHARLFAQQGAQLIITDVLGDEDCYITAAEYKNDGGMTAK